MKDGIGRRGRPGSAGLTVLLLAGLVLGSCAGAGSESGGSASGRCVFRYATDNSKGGQVRWGPCNNHDPYMNPIFEEKQAPDAG